MGWGVRAVLNNQMGGRGKGRGNPIRVKLIPIRLVPKLLRLGQMKNFYFHSGGGSPAVVNFSTAGSRKQISFLPPKIDDYVGKEDPVRVYDAFIESLDLREMGIITDPYQAGALSFIWLISGILSDYRTIARFRSDNKLPGNHGRRTRINRKSRSGKSEQRSESAYA